MCAPEPCLVLSLRWHERTGIAVMAPITHPVFEVEIDSGDTTAVALIHQIRSELL